jgi:microcystin-dependent protein
MGYIKGIDVSGHPIGAIVDFGHATLPVGFVACNGSVQSQTGIYAKLYAKITSTYNTGGEGAGNFRLPLSNGRTRIAPGNYTDSVSGSVTRTAGQYLGAEKHVMTTSEMPSHSHNVPGGYNQNNNGSVCFPPMADVNTSSYDRSTSSEGSNASHNNMQPSLVIGNVGIAYL